MVIQTPIPIGKFRRTRETRYTPSAEIMGESYMPPWRCWVPKAMLGYRPTLISEPMGLSPHLVGLKPAQMLIARPDPRWLRRYNFRRRAGRLGGLRNQRPPQAEEAYC